MFCHGDGTTDGDRKLSVRLPSEDVALLECLVRANRYGSMNDAVRSAVGAMLSEEYSPERREKALAGHPAEVEASLLTSDGSDPEEAVSDAIARGIGSGKRR